jgi:ribonuclease HI
MDENVYAIVGATGCNEDQAKAAVAALIDLGWSPPIASIGATDQPAQSAAIPALADIPTGSILTAHTDGACSGNPGPGAWSVVFSIDDRTVAEFTGSAAATTNNRMELTAVLEAIKRAPVGPDLVIATDSQNVIGWLTKGWKRNDAILTALSAKIDAAIAERTASEGGKVTFRHVLGHNSDPLNERADQLAKAAIRR